MISATRLMFLLCTSTNFTSHGIDEAIEIVGKRLGGGVSQIQFVIRRQSQVDGLTLYVIAAYGYSGRPSMWLHQHGARVAIRYAEAIDDIKIREIYRKIDISAAAAISIRGLSG